MQHAPHAPGYDWRRTVEPQANVLRVKTHLLSRAARRPSHNALADYPDNQQEDPVAAHRDGIEFLPGTTFLARLWAGDIV